MSYILDALHKSEQARGNLAERQNTRIEYFHHSTVLSFRTLAIALLAMTSIATWLHPWQQQAPAEKTPLLPLRQAARLPNAIAAIEAHKPRSRAMAKESKPATGRNSAAAIPATLPGSEKAVAIKSAIPASIIDFSQLPQALQRELPRISVSGYANMQGDSSGKMVAINDRLLREKDELSPGLRLEEIGESSPVFSYKGYRFRAP